jgi:hypothetical protein
MQGTTHNLAELAEWMRSLPLPSLAPPGLLLVIGLATLLFGARLLRPTLALGAIFLGVTLAVGWSRVLGSTMSPLWWALFGAIGGVIAATLGYRLLLSAGSAAIGLTLASLVASAAIEAGIVAGPAPEARAETSAASTSAAGTEGARPEVDPPPLPEGVIASLGPWFDRYAGDLGGAFAAAGDELRSRWSRLVGPERTFFLATLAAGAFIGLLLGLMNPNGTARVVTSLLGGLFLLAGGVPLLVRSLESETVRAGPAATPLRWLAAWLAIAFLGWLFQLRTKPAPKPEPDPGAQPAGA